MHKGDCGRVFILAGSKGMTGAAALCANAVMRSGSGLVAVGTPASEQPVLAVKLTEAMTVALPDGNGVVSKDALGVITEQAEKSDAVIIGPGLGKTADTWMLVEGLLKQKKPLLIDADGLNALSEHIELLEPAGNDVVLTPHPKEMSRLCGLDVDMIQKNRRTVAAEFAQKWGVTLLLKGADTVIASPRGEVHINPSGNDGMASGGMGDVLSGVIGALMGQGLSGYHAAVLGAFLHGLAGDLAASEIGKAGMIASDVVTYLPKAFLALERP
jgi:NAD(P)H-hydrate epimerase